MRCEPFGRTSLAIILGAALPLGLAGCSAMPLLGGKPKVVMRMTATPNSNDCGKSTGFPLRFRVLQLKDHTALAGVTLADLWDKEDKLLGAAFISRSQDAVVEPGARKELSVELDPETRAVVVVGDFCSAQGTCWFYARSRRGGGVSLDLIADAACLRPRR